MDMINIMILGLAGWRIASLLYVEKGPFNIFVKLREKIGIEHYDDDTPYVYPDSFFSSLFSCMWCLSVWVSGTMVLAYIFLPVITIWFALWLALSTIIILLDRIL